MNEDLQNLLRQATAYLDSFDATNERKASALFEVASAGYSIAAAIDRLADEVRRSSEAKAVQ